AAALALHDRRRVLHAEEDAAQEDAERLVEAADGDVLDPAADAGVARVVEDAVEPAEARDGVGDGPGDVGLAADVGAHMGGAGAELGRQAPAAVGVDVGDDDGGALGDEQAHGRLADAAGAA